MSQNRKFKFKGKQALLLGLTALVITAGYYRWNVESQRFASVPAAGDALPANAEQEGQEEQEGQDSQPQEAQNQDDAGQEESQEGASPGIARLKQERDSARSEMLEQWKETAQNTQASQETKQDAEGRVKAANEYIQQEKAIETLVKAKGYADCFAQVGESGVAVMVSGGEINGSKVSQIKDIVVDETGVEPRQIKISAE